MKSGKVKWLSSIVLSITLVASVLFLSGCLIGCSAGATSTAIIDQSNASTRKIVEPSPSSSSQSSPQNTQADTNNEEQSAYTNNGSHSTSLYDESTEVVEITEKLFVAQSNDVYLNPDEYLGKIIRYEGIFTTFEYPEDNKIYHTVIRYGPGCCGTDANCGFVVIWPDKWTNEGSDDLSDEGQARRNTFPQEGDWVEVTGVLEEYEAYGFQQLRIALISLKVLDVRGAEYVTQ